MTELTLGTTAIRILAAFACGALIGAERVMRGKAAGLRTHIIVCIGSCLTVLTGLYVTVAYGISIDVLRIGAQVVSGIGFLGVGTILVKGHSQVIGLTTAAALWTTSIIGLALGAGYYEGAVIVTLFTFISVYFINRLEEKLNEYRRDYEMYVEIDDIRHMDMVLKDIEELYDYKKLVVTKPRSGVTNNVGLELIVLSGRKVTAKEVHTQLKGIEHVVLAADSI